MHANIVCRVRSATLVKPCNSKANSFSSEPFLINSIGNHIEISKQITNYHLMIDTCKATVRYIHTHTQRGRESINYLACGIFVSNFNPIRFHRTQSFDIIKWNIRPANGIPHCWKLEMCHISNKNRIKMTPFGKIARENRCRWWKSKIQHC